ncbi:hypothetical protein [Nonomuraea jiangxiensis]|uniref:hypothetical protein n=1 Tax=Nonomuraea jiangxiensis TaxID=633440 RepID=UPI00115FAF0A|nr:hypothetical protein [Nonomuraea jiangxiensis]
MGTERAREVPPGLVVRHEEQTAEDGRHRMRKFLSLNQSPEPLARRTPGVVTKDLPPHRVDKSPPGTVQPARYLPRSNKVRVVCPMWGFTR